jgi:hypothetical protein
MFDAETNGFASQPACLATATISGWSSKNIGRSPEPMLNRELIASKKRMSFFGYRISAL